MRAASRARHASLSCCSCPPARPAAAKPAASGFLAAESLGASAIPYQPSNAFAPAGYKESLLGENRYRIEVTGYPNSSHAQMEKIVQTRAAQIGKEMRLRYFKVENMQHTTSCTAARSTPKGGGHRDLNYRILTADVTYARSQPDPSYLESSTSFDRLSTELKAPSPADGTPPFQCPPA